MTITLEQYREIAGSPLMPDLTKKYAFDWLSEEDKKTIMAQQAKAEPEQEQGAVAHQFLDTERSCSDI